MKKSLRVKLQNTITISMIILLSLLVTGYLYTYISSSEEDQKKLIHNGLSLTDQRITDFHYVNVSSLEMFVNDAKKAISDNDDINEDHINTSIVEYNNLFQSGVSMALALEDGSMFSANAAKLPDGFDPRTRPWYKDALNHPGEVYLSEPYLTAKEDEVGTYVFTYSKSLEDKHGDIMGVAGVNIDLKRIFMFESNLELPSRSFIAIAANNGQVMISNYQDKRVIQQVIVPSLQNGEGYLSDIVIGETTYKVYGRKNAQTHWLSLVFVPNDVLNALWINTLIAAGVFLLILVITIRYLAQSLSSRISKPIEEVVLQLKELDLLVVHDEFKKPHSDLIEVEALSEGINHLLMRVVEQHAMLQEKHRETRNQYMEIEALYEETTAMNETLNDTMNQLQESWMQTIRVLSNAIEANDHYTKGHCDRVAELSYKIGEKLDLNPRTLKNLEVAALLHDVGKVSVPYSVLNKEGRLTDEEYELVKHHAEAGYNIVKDVPNLANSADYILHHHERMDGKGYPDGLQGEAINIESRILAVVDAFDAMTSSRPYRKEPMTVSDALEELRKYENIQFDPEVIKVLEGILMDENESLR